MHFRKQDCACRFKYRKVTRSESDCPVLSKDVCEYFGIINSVVPVCKLFVTRFFKQIPTICQSL